MQEEYAPCDLLNVVSLPFHTVFMSAVFCLGGGLTLTFDMLTEEDLLFVIILLPLAQKDGVPLIPPTKLWLTEETAVNELNTRDVGRDSEVWNQCNANALTCDSLPSDRETHPTVWWIVFCVFNC